MQSGAAALENNLTVPQKVKHVFIVHWLPYDPALPLPGVSPERNRNLIPYPNL